MWKRKHRRLTVVFVLSMFIPAGGGASPMEHDLIFDTPAPTWDEAMPLANGILGALVWGDGHPLKISLDRTDLWDLRPVPEFHSDEYSYSLMRRWVREGRIEELHRVYDKPYRHAGPTKIPAGRIELDFEETGSFRQTRLRLEDAVATIDLEDGLHAEVWVHATQPAGFIKIENAGKVRARVVAPAFGGPRQDFSKPRISAGELARLEYDPPKESTGENWAGYLQEGWGGFRYAVVLAWRTAGKTWLGCWSIVTSEESQDPMEKAIRTATSNLEKDPADAYRTHRDWWSRYWRKVRLNLPNPVLERQWYLETYKFGAAARRGCPPISLQGPWTADDGKLPPWKGDYHHDLNTQLSYWPCYTGNRLEAGLGFLDWLWETRGNCEEWTRRFFGKPGLNVPGTADLQNRQIGGWHQYTHSSTTGCWLAQHFYLHWRYSMDREFLATRAYPYLREVARFIEAVTERDENGLRTLPLTSSPEIHDNRLEAWFQSPTNYDVALIRWLLGATSELAEELGRDDEAAHWKQVLSEMPELAFSSEDRRLLVAGGTPLHESHRHFSHLMAIYPLRLIRWSDGDPDRRTIRAALAEMDELGTSLWTGYSFSWKACIAAEARDGELAEETLEIFSKAFCLRNSFHCNGDQSGKGYSNFTYRPFTLEGNFAAAAGIQEMLLQSDGGILDLFPAIPKDWKEASFRGLRAEGAFVVDASLEGGSVRRVAVTSEKGGTCRLVNPFGDAAFEVAGISRDVWKREKDLLVFETQPNAHVVLVRKP